MVYSMRNEEVNFVICISFSISVDNKMSRSPNKFTQIKENEVANTKLEMCRISIMVFSYTILLVLNAHAFCSMSISIHSDGLPSLIILNFQISTWSIEMFGYHSAVFINASKFISSTKHTFHHAINWYIFGILLW